MRHSRSRGRPPERPTPRGRRYAILFSGLASASDPDPEDDAPLAVRPAVPGPSATWRPVVPLAHPGGPGRGTAGSGGVGACHTTSGDPGMRAAFPLLPCTTAGLRRGTASVSRSCPPAVVQEADRSTDAPPVHDERAARPVSDIETRPWHRRKLRKVSHRLHLGIPLGLHRPLTGPVYNVRTLEPGGGLHDA